MELKSGNKIRFDGTIKEIDGNIAHIEFKCNNKRTSHSAWMDIRDIKDVNNARAEDNNDDFSRIENAINFLLTQNYNKIRDMFAVTTIRRVFENYSLSEILEKIENEALISIGDCVYITSTEEKFCNIGVVMKKIANGGTAIVLIQDGTEVACPVDSLKKTGRKINVKNWLSEIL